MLSSYICTYDNGAQPNQAGDSASLLRISLTMKLSNRTGNHNFQKKFFIIGKLDKLNKSFEKTGAEKLWF